jgi:hypothetical protein
VGLEEEGDGAEEGDPGGGSGVAYGGRRGGGPVCKDKVPIYVSARDSANFWLACGLSAGLVNFWLTVRGI